MKSMKKAFAMFLAFCVLLSSVGITAFADTGEGDPPVAAKAMQQEKQIGTAPYYELDDDHNISGAGVESSYVEAQNKFVEAWKDINATGTENVFDITLKVITKEQIETLTAPENAAVMLIMDESRSMENDITVKGVTKKKKEFAQDAAKSFIEDYIDGAGDAVRMLSIINFAEDANRVLGWTDMVKSTESAIEKINAMGSGWNTNIEGALMLARNNIVDGKKRTPENGGIQGISRVYVILLTDGSPSAYMETANTTALEALVGNYVQDGLAPDVAYKGINDKFTEPKRDGLATDLKSHITNLYTIAFDTDGYYLNITKDYSNTEKEQKVSAAKWLEDYVASKDCAKNVRSDVGLAFKNISTEIAKLAKAWIITDPMSDYVEFDQDYSSEIKVDSSESAAKYSTADDTLYWDLKKVTPDVSGKGDTKTYHYELTYRVKLQTELLTGLAADVFPTNKTTNLTYLITDKENDNVISVEGNIDLLVPAVKPAYTVEYSYWVNGVRVEDYTKVENGVWSGFVKGQEYNIGADNVYTPYVHEGSNYDFVYATSTDKSDPAYGTTAAKEHVRGTIDKANVTIDLYYIDKSVLNVSLTKKIKKDQDETWPKAFTFDFTLANEQNKEVGTLTMTQDHFVTNSYTGSFTWTDEMTSIESDLLGQTLRLYEESGTEWNPLSVPAGGIDYVKIQLDGSVNYLPIEGSICGVVVNDYVQTPVLAEIELKKFFGGDFEHFNYQENDGSILDCDWEAHEHILPDIEDSCYELECVLPDFSSHDSETCDNCLNEEFCEYAAHEHEDDCYALVCAYADKDTHEHGMECYKYTFIFTLYDEKEKELATEEKVLSAAEIIKLHKGQNPVSITFTGIPYPEKGIATYTIKESGVSYIGWTTSGDKKVRVNRLGEVKYFCNKGYVEMTNLFDGAQAPYIELSKDVIDGRTDSIISDYSGTFNFELKDTGSGWTKNIELKMDGGSDGMTIELPEYLERTATLELREIPGDDPEFTYDGIVYTINIADGVATLEGAEVAEFENIFFKAITPEIQIVKTTNGENGTFKFYITDGEGVNEAVTIKTDGGVGADTVFKGLKPNYSGTVTVKEAQDWIDADGVAVSDDWFFDNTVYAFTYELGILTGVAINGNPIEQVDDTATAKFNNNNIALKIDFKKAASATSVKPNTLVKYTLTTINKSAEALANVVIFDEMLKGYEGKLTVTKVVPAKEPEILVTGSSLGYEFNKTAGTITLLSDLEIGGTVYVDYAITFTATGKYPNKATVTAVGKDTERRISRDTNVTVTVSTTTEKKDHSKTTPPTKTTPKTTPVTIPEVAPPLVNTPVVKPDVVIVDPNVPLADIPQTGTGDDIAFNLMMLGISLSALLTLLTIRRKKEQ